ncbi:MAG: Tm-1-like ATP-binding domain-containing protein [Desulfobacterales bacterium]
MMGKKPTIAVVGTFDTKAEEHIFIKNRIEQTGLGALTVNVGSRSPSPVAVDLDLYKLVVENNPAVQDSRDKTIAAMIDEARIRIKKLYAAGEIAAMISAGGGTGTHIATSIMHELPLGVPKVMVSTVASRNMAKTVGTKDITMIHSVADLLGVNSVSGRILDKAAAGISGMVQSSWQPDQNKKRIALPFFGFITPAAEATRHALEKRGYEVIAFHANGTGGMAMEELAAQGYFHGILDLATHELADHLLDGYCGDIGPQRFEPVLGQSIPRLVVPGGLDCAVLEFTRHDIPAKYKDRKIFFYDFRSAIRLNEDETRTLADQLTEKLNKDASNIKILIPLLGWSAADCEGGPLYDPPMNQFFTRRLKEKLDPQIQIKEADHHINDPAFAAIAAQMMDQMIRGQT